MPEQQELMLILGAEHSPGDWDERYRVTQRVSPHVVIVEPAAGTTKEELQTMDGVHTVLEVGETVDGDVRRTLTDTEALFVDAGSRQSASLSGPLPVARSH